MAKRITFDEKSSERISQVVRRVEAMPLPIGLRPSKPTSETDELPFGDADYQGVYWDTTLKIWKKDWLRFHA